MKLSFWALLVFLISFPMIGAAAGSSPQISAALMHRSQSAVNWLNGSPYTAINSTETSPTTSSHHAIAMPRPTTTEKPKPQKTWWQRNRVNVIFGTHLVTVGLLGVTGWYVKGAVSSAVAQVQSEIAPISQAANDIIAAASILQNITDASKP